MLNRRSIFGVLVLLCAMSSIALADQPFMRAARADLQKAKVRLQNATANKGGHRVKAIEYINTAIGLVNQGIAYDRRHNHASASLGEALNPAMTPDQPNMQAALEHLRQAKDNLERATSDKGGFRVRAIDAVKAAIDETKKGIDAGE